MANTAFQVTIASVGETYFAGAAYSISVPGQEGVLEVLANHEPFISTLKEGVVRVTPENGKPVSIDINGGVLEVSNNSAVVLLS